MENINSVLWNAEEEELEEVLKEMRVVTDIEVACITNYCATTSLYCVHTSVSSPLCSM